MAPLRRARLLARRAGGALKEAGVAAPRLLPRAGPPPAGDGASGARARAARDRRGGEHQPRAPDEPRADPRAGGGGGGRRAGRAPLPPIDCSGCAAGLRAALPVHRHSLPQIALDAALLALAYFVAYQLRFDGGVPEDYQELFTRTLSFVVIGGVFIFGAFGLYRHWMRYSSQREYLRIGQASLTLVLALAGYVAVVQPKLVVRAPRGDVALSIPASVLALFGLLTFVCHAGVRFAVHAFYERPFGGFRARRGARSVLIVGAGDGGRLVLREILRNPDLGLRPVGFVDDDPRKQSVRVDRGLRVLGTTAELAHVLEDVEPDEVLIAIPSAPGTLRARVVSACRERGVARAHDADGLRAAADRRRRYIRQVREVRVEDVLGREPVRMDIEPLGGYLTGRCVMVTGAGGSIGAELCRQIARVGPEPARADRPRRGQPVRDRARAGRGPARAQHRRGARRLQGGGAHAGGVPRAPPDRRLPRRRLQARRR